jgi:hypothetical protein
MAVGYTCGYGWVDLCGGSMRDLLRLFLLTSFALGGCAGAADGTGSGLFARGSGSGAASDEGSATSEDDESGDDESGDDESGDDGSGDDGSGDDGSGDDGSGDD